MAGLLPGLDAGDAHLRELAAEAAPHAVAGLVLVLEDVDLRALAVVDNLRGHRDLGERTRVGGDGVTVDEHERLHLEGGARLARDPGEDDEVTDSNLLLTAARPDDRVHLVFPSRVDSPRGCTAGA